MSAAHSRNPRMEEASAQAQVPNEVQHLVAGALIREVEPHVVEIAPLINLELRLVEQACHCRNLLIVYRMFHNHNGIVHITALYEIVAQEIFQLMEEYEGTAGCYLA